MKRLFVLMAVFALIALISSMTYAAPGTLYMQEGTSNDGPASINAAGEGPGGTAANWTNWKYQYGSGWYRGVYAADTYGWLDEGSDGNMDLEIEADIEMYIYEAISGNKVYFHIGNPYTAGDGDKTAYVYGSFSSNNGMYIGLTFDGTKTAANFEKVGSAFTGKILHAMKSDRDTWRTQNFDFDIEMMLTDDGGTTWYPPVAYDVGSHGTIPMSLWWRPASFELPGAHNYAWRIKLLIDADQPDGDYHLDPAIVAVPEL